MTAPRPGGGSETLATRLVQLAFFAAVLGAWYAESVRGAINPLLFPQLGAVVGALGTVLVAPATADDLAVTLGTFALAFGIAVVTGIAAGYAVSATRLLIAVYEPMLAALYAVPLIVFFPTFVLLFGTGIRSKLAIGVLAAFFPIALNTIAGFSRVDGRLRTAARSMGASRGQTLRRVLLPGAAPIITAGLRIAFIPCFASVLAGEMISSDAGLGHEIAHEAQMMETARMFAYVVLAVAVAAVFNLGLSALEGRRRGR